MLSKVIRIEAHQPAHNSKQRTRLIWLIFRACLSLLVLTILFTGMVERSGNAQLPVQRQAQVPPPPLAKVINENLKTAIAGQYIVIFKRGTSRNAVLSAEKTAVSLGGQVGFTYTSAQIGFSAKLPPPALKAIQANTLVDYIEADQRFSFDFVQLNPPKGLDRTSERLLSLDNQYTYSETGAGVNAYVIDSGIRVTHNQFQLPQPRAFLTPFTACPGDFSDGVGHGTHVAGTIGGTTVGIAKGVNLFSVKVADCLQVPTLGNIIAGVDWVTLNAVHPAVANMSLGGPASAALDTAVTNSIASGVTYVIAAGNNNADACNVSPARVPAAITVGNIDPTNDTRASNSNFGTCLDLFAPGEGIQSSLNTSDSSTALASGTSMAAPHVAGAAAFYLQNNPMAAPAAVWGGLNGVHFNNNVSTTPGWPGVINRGAGSPNELLHWGSVSDGFDDGEPHITTVDGVHYDFQSAGEFITLREPGGLEIQTRKTPVATTFAPGTNFHTGLASCVSINTAVAARVGSHRVTFQPGPTGVLDPNGLELRVDGILTTLTLSGINLGPGGRVIPSLGNGIQIDFPDGTTLIGTPGTWAPLGKWYLNLSVFHTPASQGIMGAIAPGSWLPALPNGASLGAKPSSLHQRYIELNQTFADAWRVTNATSLFDYAPGTSTATFTNRSWPQESGACVLPRSPRVNPIEPQVAQQLCREIVGKQMNADCIFDVRVTGEAGFAKTYLLSQQIRAGSTAIIVSADKDLMVLGEVGSFTASVVRNGSGGRGAPAGTVQFILNEKNIGEPVRLDSEGRATWKTASLPAGNHQLAARYTPSNGSVFFGSTSIARRYTVRGSVNDKEAGSTRPATPEIGLHLQSPGR
jgi:subtilisin family serine protease